MRKCVAFFVLTSVALSLAASSSTLKNYKPFGKDAYLTSSFGENRGTRYHAGVDYSTSMEEGWPILAPENGSVEEARVSPYFYGKVYYYKGESGTTYVFAHQSGFNKIIDSLVRTEQYKNQKNDVKIWPKVKFKKGDTLSFAGSSGIGNPHLHLEMRPTSDDVISPCHNGAVCGDTLEPLILGAYTWNETEEAFTSEDALKNRCLALPSKGGFAAFKIADYSKEPLENPMSVSRVSIFEQTKNGKKGKKIFERKYDKLKFSTMIEIRERLLWAEEADTAGDYHFINQKINKNIILEVEDFVGHTAKRTLAIKPSCNEDYAPTFTKFQEGPVFSYASRSFLKLECNDSRYTYRNDSSILSKDLCKDSTLASSKQIRLASIVKQFGNNQHSYIDIFKDGKKTKTVFLSGIDATELEIADNATRISQKLTKPVKLTGIDEVLAVVKNENDSVPFYEFHPKGLHFKGNWEVCLDTNFAKAPLYYLGETTRRWFIFSKQKNENGMRCASMNELRDIGSVTDTTAPALGAPYLATAPVTGIQTQVVRIPVIEKYAGIENGNAINAYALEGDSSKWIYAEYDSEPKEIVLEKAICGSKVKIEIQDEAGNAASYFVEIPN